MSEFALPLMTDRLTLRGFGAEDVDNLFALYGNPDVVRYLYDDVVERDAIATRLAGYTDTVPVDGEWLSLAMEHDGTFVGQASLCFRSAEHRQAEIGYILHPTANGHGYATEASARMMQLAFEELGVHRVVGRIEARNAASERVLQRLGMRKEAHLIQNEWVKGEWNDEIIYAITEPEWRRAQVPTEQLSS